jgi:hypothetical protein
MFSVSRSLSSFDSTCIQDEWWKLPDIIVWHTENFNILNVWNFTGYFDIQNIAESEVSRPI